MPEEGFRTDFERYLEEEVLVSYRLSIESIRWLGSREVDEGNTGIQDFAVDDVDYFLVRQLSPGEGVYPLDREGLLIPVHDTASRYVKRRVEGVEGVPDGSYYFSLYRLRSRQELV